MRNAIRSAGKYAPRAAAVLGAVLVVSSPAHAALDLSTLVPDFSAAEIIAGLLAIGVIMLAARGGKWAIRQVVGMFR